MITGRIVEVGVKCKIWGCKNKALISLGDNAGVCQEHFGIKHIKCRRCGAERVSECAFAWSVPRWNVIMGGRKCPDGKKHEWIEKERGEKG